MSTFSRKGCHEGRSLTGCCDPRPTSDEEDVQRLTDVLAAISEDNDYNPALLVVGWTSDLPPLFVRLLELPCDPFAATPADT